MSRQLQHSPADVVRYLLIALGEGLLPPATPWPVYEASEPDSPDAVVTVFDTAGMGDGRLAPTGEAMSHPGIQVRVRSAKPKEGWYKASRIRTALSEEVREYRITVESSNYLIHCLSNFGDVLSIGKESETSKRSVFVLNCRVSLRQCF